MNIAMDLTKKKEQLLAERTACEQTKQDAHNRIIEINATLKKLERLISEADEILGGDEPIKGLILIENRDGDFVTPKEFIIDNNG